MIAAKRFLLIACTLLIAGLLPAHADEWTKTYQITGKPDLHVDTSDANINVSTWDQNTIEAKVITSHYKIGPDGIRVEEHQTGDSVEIDVRYPRRMFSIDFGNHRVEINIRMPREGKLDLETGDGRINLGNFKGEMDLKSGDGSETLDAVDGRLRATTGDGHIKANGRFDDLDLKTGDGHIEVQAAAGSTVNGSWRLETGDGSVTLGIPSNLAADVDLHTSDGHIDLDMPVTTQGKLSENEVRGKLNGGGNLMTIRTGDGSIRLQRS